MKNLFTQNNQMSLKFKIISFFILFSLITASPAYAIIPNDITISGDTLVMTYATADYVLVVQRILYDVSGQPISREYIPATEPVFLPHIYASIYLNDCSDQINFRERIPKLSAMAKDNQIIVTYENRVESTDTVKLYFHNTSGAIKIVNRKSLPIEDDSKLRSKPTHYTLAHLGTENTAFLSFGREDKGRAYVDNVTSQNLRVNCIFPNGIPKDL